MSVDNSNKDFVVTKNEPKNAPLQTVESMLNYLVEEKKMKEPLVNIDAATKTEMLSKLNLNNKDPTTISKYINVIKRWNQRAFQKVHAINNEIPSSSKSKRLIKLEHLVKETEELRCSDQSEKALMVNHELLAFVLDVILALYQKRTAKVFPNAKSWIEQLYLPILLTRFIILINYKDKIKGDSTQLLTKTIDMYEKTEERLFKLFKDNLLKNYKKDEFYKFLCDCKDGNDEHNTKEFAFIRTNAKINFLISVLYGDIQPVSQGTKTNNSEKKRKRSEENKEKNKKKRKISSSKNQTEDKDVLSGIDMNDDIEKIKKENESLKKEIGFAKYEIEQSKIVIDNRVKQVYDLEQELTKAKEEQITQITFHQQKLKKLKELHEEVGKIFEITN